MPMRDPDYDHIGPAVVGAVEDTLKGTASVLRRHLLVFFGAASLVALGMTLFNAYTTYKTREVVILGGPVGGGGILKARKLADYLESYGSSMWGRRYVARVESTGGYAENARRIHADKTGRMIGLAHDGFENVDSVRTLIPLDRQFLHVICNKEFYKELTGIDLSEIAEDQPTTITLGDITRALKSDMKGDKRFTHRVYLGPPGSGTRWVAECVLKQYGVNPGKLVAYGIASWEEMRGALNSGAIGLGFLLTEKDSQRIGRIASDGESILVSIDHAGTIADFNEHLSTAPFSRNSYSTMFCPGPLVTVAAKRVYACSELLDREEAFLLANHIKRSEGLSKVGWGTEEDGKFGYGLHPGAALLKEDETPKWLQNVDPGNFFWSTVGVAILLSILTEVARRQNVRLQAKRVDVEVVEPEDVTTAQFKLTSKVEGELIGDDVEQLADRLAQGESQGDVDQMLDYAIQCSQAKWLTDEVRSSFLDVVSRFADEHPVAQSAIAAIIGDDESSTIYRQEAIRYASELAKPNDQVLTALLVATQNPALAQEAKAVLQRSQEQLAGELDEKN